eukprot:9501242-Pyramimonas_sp.AAC.1
MDVGAQQDTALRRILPEGAHHFVEVIPRTGAGKRREARRCTSGPRPSPLLGQLPRMLQQRALY